MILKSAKKKTTTTTSTTLSCKINTTFYFGKQEDRELARVVARTFPMYERMC